MTQKIEISSKTIIFTVVFLILLRVLWTAREVIYALFLAFIFMSALKPSVNELEKRHLPRTLAAILVFLATLVAFFFISAFIIPPFVTESLSFLRNLPTLVASSLPFISGVANGDSLIRFLPNITSNFFKVASSFFSNLIFVISVLFFTLYFLMEEKFLKNFLERFLDDNQVVKIINIVAKTEKRMGAWMWGELMLMTIIGVMTYIGLSLLGIHYALPLAVIAGLLEVVPIIGPTISMIPAFFVGLSISPIMTAWVALLYIVIQQLENNLIVPFVMKRAVGLHPIITLVALTIGGKLAGFMGVLLAVPVALFAETLLLEMATLKK